MIKKIFSLQLWMAVLAIGVLASCEQEDNLVGFDIVGNNAANLNSTTIDLSATNYGADTIRSDRKILQNATIGAYEEPTFGLSKSSFYTQVRLGTLNPNFGRNAVVDSVVLSIPVFAKSDTISFSRRKINTYYTKNTTADDCAIADTISQYYSVAQFEMDSIYGNKNAQMTLRVSRVLESMGTIDSVYYSNKDFLTGELFGSKTIDKDVLQTSLVQYLNKNTTDSAVLSSDSTPQIKMKLEGMRSFVQENIVNQSNSANLSDQISFISNVLKGIKLDVEENDGFIFNFSPQNLTLTAYISSDNANFTDVNNNGVDDDEEDCPVIFTKPRVSSTLNFLVGSGLIETSTKYYNVTQNHVINSNGNFTANQTNSATNYLKGMGGASVKLSLDPSQIENLRNQVNNNNWIINEAHIKVYPDFSAQGKMPLPEYLHLYNQSQNILLADYGNVDNLTSDQKFPYSQVSLAYDSEKGYYLLRCTEFIKNIIEKNEPKDDLLLQIGTYLGVDQSTIFYTPASPFSTNRIFNPYRLAIVGTNPDASLSSRKLQLEVLYSKKN